MRRGILFLISAPSGGGKSTLLKLLSSYNDFAYSVSCTTRAPRPGEVEGKDYFFLSHEEFERRVAAGEFLEHARVHGNCYGTLRDAVMRSLENGQDVLLDVDVQGADQIRNNAGDNLRGCMVDVFLTPPTMAELERRLKKRNTETAEQLAVRLENAHAEMMRWKDYHYLILSGSPQEDLENFRAIMLAERLRADRLTVSF
jgi:guanylate kinase